MAYCLVPKLADEFKKRIASGELDIAKLADMDSKGRNAELGKFLKEADAKNVNSLFESKLLLKNQQLGMENWVKQVSGIKPEVKRDMISRIQKLEKVLDADSEKAFLSELAEKRLGVGVTFDEAKTIASLSSKRTEAKAAMEAGGNRFEYGASKRALENFVNDIKAETKTLGFRERIKPRYWLDNVSATSGLAKSLRASIDNSFIGRQGIKVLFTNPVIWGKNALTSFKIIGKTLVEKKGAISQGDVVLADIYSRDNMLKGRYKKMKLDIGTGEEAFPTAIPAKIPGLGRLFKASEQAYTATAYKMRADLADHYIKVAERFGKDVDDPDFLKSMGAMINSLTGRGSIGKAEGIAKELNNVFFSVKFLKSNIDTLIQPVTATDPFVRKLAAKNLMKIVAGIGTTLAIAELLHPGSVTLDTKSANFGKIKIGETRFDITGGMGALITMASRIINQKSTSSTSGKTTELGSGFGQTSGTEVMFRALAENKLSPMAQVIKQVFIDRAGFMGEEITPLGVLEQLTVPMPISNVFERMKDSSDSSALQIMSAILDGLGISADTYADTKKQTGNSPIKSKNIIKKKNLIN